MFKSKNKTKTKKKHIPFVLKIEVLQEDISPTFLFIAMRELVLNSASFYFMQAA